jgi:N-acetylglucosamine kinase-like BadF-type ATPase
MQALGCVARAEDGRAQRTGLRDRLLQHLGLSDARMVIDWIERASKADVAALAPVVVETARSGDPVAASIATDAAAALRTHLVAVLDRLESDAGADAASAVGLALWGGLIAPGGALRSVLEPLIEPLGLRLVEHVIDPALGAAELARRLV